jgi:dihydrofolate reductase
MVLTNKTFGEIVTVARTLARARGSDGEDQRPSEHGRRHSTIPQEIQEIIMRKLTAAFFMSLDGVVESPDKWHFPYFNDEMGAAISGSMSQADALLMGRVNYQEWASYWPNQSGDDTGFADYMNNTPKFVVSTTLETVEWQNSTLIKGDFRKEIIKLKEQPGREITISGSATLVRSLLHEELLDELRLMVHPVVVGSGKRLFDDWSDQKALGLVNSQTFSTGVVDLTYQPADQ